MLRQYPDLIQSREARTALRHRPFSERRVTLHIGHSGAWRPRVGPISLVDSSFPAPEGLHYTADFVSPAIEKELISAINGHNKQARRYHWHSEELKSFVDDPHTAIDGHAQGEIVNLTDKRAESSRNAQLELLAGLGPDRIVSEHFPPFRARCHCKGCPCKPCFRI